MELCDVYELMAIIGILMAIAFSFVLMVSDMGDVGVDRWLWIIPALCIVICLSGAIMASAEGCEEDDCVKCCQVVRYK